MTFVIGFDADDTLWHCENHFAQAQDQFTRILAPYQPGQIPLSRLTEIEKRNMRLYGFGVKGFMLSMIETAVDITDGRIGGDDVKKIIALGRAILEQPLELIEDARETLEILATHHRLLLITKGDLLDQEAKITRSGLAPLFAGVEIVSQKDESAYRRLLARHDVATSQFIMVGNSVPSDILPVLALGGRAIHIPYHITAAHETVAEEQLAGTDPLRVDYIREIPDLIRTLED